MTKRHVTANVTYQLWSKMILKLWLMVYLWINGNDKILYVSLKHKSLQADFTTTELLGSDNYSLCSYYTKFDSVFGSWQWKSCKFRYGKCCPITRYLLVLLANRPEDNSICGNWPTNHLVSWCPFRKKAPNPVYTHPCMLVLFSDLPIFDINKNRWARPPLEYINVTNYEYRSGMHTPGVNVVVTPDTNLRAS